MRIDRGYRNVNLSLSSVRERKLSRSQTPFQIINQKIRDEMSLVLWSGFSSGNDGSFSVVCRLLTPASSLIPWCRRLVPCRFHPAFIILEKNGEEGRHRCGFKAVGGGLTGSGWDLGTVSIDKECRRRRWVRWFWFRRYPVKHVSIFCLLRCEPRRLGYDVVIGWRMSRF